MTDRNDELIFLKRKAYELRCDVINMIYNSDTKNGHFGGSLSVAEIIAALYFHEMNINPSDPQWPDRDRLVLSKGHSVPILYAALAHKGYFDKKVLDTYRDQGSILQGHPDSRKTPGIDTSSGSLGQGLSVALGMALGAKQFSKKFRVYALLSEGEMQEGMTWEAVMAASHYGLDNLTGIIDCNNLQIGGAPSKIMNIEPLADKLRSFGWEVATIDGNDIASILSAIEMAKKTSCKPFAVICKTIKGKGVSFMENDKEWHCNSISLEQKNKALNELKEFI